MTEFSPQYMGETESWYLRRNMAETGAGLNVKGASQFPEDDAAKMNRVVNTVIRTHKEMAMKIEQIDATLQSTQTLVSTVMDRYQGLAKAVESQNATIRDMNNKNFQHQQQFEYFKAWAQAKFDKCIWNTEKLDKRMMGELNKSITTLANDHKSLLEMWDLTQEEVENMTTRLSSTEKANHLMRKPIFSSFQKDLNTLHSLADQAKPGTSPTSHHHGPLGMQIADCMTTAGVTVVAVRESGAAAIAGVQRGNIIISVNDHRVRDRGDFRVAIEEATQGDTAMSTFAVLRDEYAAEPYSLTVVLGATRAVRPQPVANFQPLSARSPRRSPTRRSPTMSATPSPTSSSRSGY
eukprot:TRINITY_DN50767_c0_g1_i1.p1 TRINITY_DN50767_c0_g1~~TRINITY_DN50767_c0_g1_i1.p1  ORF type:complete len:350 (-),score=33.04 TRINITY_DN50767_c0_g1_i1:103-1152(-)